jgi:hypothetical protein
MVVLEFDIVICGVCGQTTKHKQGYNRAKNHIGFVNGVNFQLRSGKAVLDSAFNLYNNQVFMAMNSDGNIRHT